MPCRKWHHNWIFTHVHACLCKVNKAYNAVIVEYYRCIINKRIEIIEFIKTKKNFVGQRKGRDPEAISVGWYNYVKAEIFYDNLIFLQQFPQERQTSDSASSFHKLSSKKLFSLQNFVSLPMMHPVKYNSLIIL